LTQQARVSKYTAKGRKKEKRKNKKKNKNLTLLLCRQHFGMDGP
jgi:hypothetical protein